MSDGGQVPSNNGEAHSSDPKANPKPETPMEMGFQFALGIGGALMAIGVLLGSVAFTYWVMPSALGLQPISQRVLWLGLLIGVVLIVVGAIVMYRSVAPYLQTHNPDAMDEPQRSEILFGMHLVGVGAALLLVALVNHVVIAAFAWSIGRPGRLPASAPSTSDAPEVVDRFGTGVREAGDGLLWDSPFMADLKQLFGGSPDEAVLVVMLLIVSSSVAILGALFYFATSLWAKMKTNDGERFDRSKFWAGLWFRLGEAVLFNLVLFLVIRNYAPDESLLLPIGSLFVGMFLKSGEQMISGLADRLFAALAALIPTTIRPETPEQLDEFDCVVTDLPAEQATRATAMKQIKAAISRLKGVKRPVRGDVATGRIIALYDPSRIVEERLAQEIRVQGYDATPKT